MSLPLLRGFRSARPHLRIRRAPALCTLSALLGTAAAVTAFGQTTPPGPLAPPVVEAGQIQLQWSQSGVLEVAPSPTGPWTPAELVGETINFHRRPLADPARFFRIRAHDGRASEPTPVLAGSIERPLPVETATVRGLGGNDALLEIKLAEGQTAPAEGAPFIFNGTILTLNDAGRDGDQRAGDGTFSGAVPIDATEIDSIQEYAAAIPEEFRQQPVFQGRSFVGVEPLPALDLAAFRQGGVLQIHPLRFAAAGVRPDESDLEPDEEVESAAQASVSPASAISPALRKPKPRSIDPGKSLLIKHLSVVEDPKRTFDPCTGRGTPMGAWTFGRLMEHMANTPVTGIPAHEFARRWLRHWEMEQVINFDEVTPRTLDIRRDIIEPWQAASGGPNAPLDLAKAPFRLLTIVNRVDLRGNSFYRSRNSNPCDPACEAGEARFVFGAVRLARPTSGGGGYNAPQRAALASLRKTSPLAGRMHEASLITSNLLTLPPDSGSLVTGTVRTNPPTLVLDPTQTDAPPVTPPTTIPTPIIVAPPVVDPPVVNPPVVNPPVVNPPVVNPPVVNPPVMNPPVVNPPVVDPPIVNPPVGGECEELPFTVIFEYCVPKHGCDAIRDWGQQWAALSRMAFGSRFNRALQSITDQFATANADTTRRPNRSALNQLRSNEILDGRIWVMREWKLFPTDSDTGHLHEVTTKQTPDFDLNASALVADYINANTPAILAERHTVPLEWRGTPFLGGSAPTPAGFFWNAPGLASGEARHRFSLNTCSGCHAGETATPFTHIFTRRAGSESALSGFLTGTTVPDPAGVTQPHQFNDLARREIDLIELIGKPCFMQLFFEPVNFRH